ncbi:group II truncated hemoglobin [Caulobacter sp.]|uniref:group II truncated hemoglobin n=1 Tax=Caulobacter sp. TaxID=78 RepID=UPI003BB214E6
MSKADVQSPSPFETVGGAPAVQRLAETFYDLMAADPIYGELRVMHADDMDAVKQSLAGFLSAWLGGPRDWFMTHPGVCVMSMHRAMPITATTAGQWIAAMERAMRAVDLEPVIAEAMLNRFRGMVDAMARR